MPEFRRLGCLTADRSTELRALAGRSDVRMLMKPLKPAALRSLLSQWRLLRPGTETVTPAP